MFAHLTQCIKCEIMPPGKMHWHVATDCLRLAAKATYSVRFEKIAHEPTGSQHKDTYLIVK